MAAVPVPPTKYVAGEIDDIERYTGLRAANDGPETKTAAAPAWLA